MPGSSALAPGGLLREVLAQEAVSSARVAGLGVTGQMHGVLLVDEEGEPLTPLISWQDGRGHHPYRGSKRSYVEALQAVIDELPEQVTGCRPATGYGAVTLLRLHESGQIPAHCTALTIHDYIVRTLCGVTVTDPTSAASWGICDVRHGARWLEAALEAFPFLRALLPPIAPTGSRAGSLGVAAATAQGLPAGLPVAVAIGDNQASFLGSVSSLADTLLLNLGTGGQMSVPTERFSVPETLEVRPLFPGRWLCVGASLCGGRALQILKDFYLRIGHELFGCASNASDEALYARMNDVAAEAALDCDGLTASTLFSGTRRDPAVRGAFGGISGENLTPANLTRACMIGMVDELLQFYRQAQGAGACARQVVGAGNAIRRLPAVRVEMERRLGLPLSLAPYSEEAAVGAALIGGMGAVIIAKPE